MTPRVPRSNTASPAFRHPEFRFRAHRPRRREGAPRDSGFAKVPLAASLPVGRVPRLPLADVCVAKVPLATCRPDACVARVPLATPSDVVGLFTIGVRRGPVGCDEGALPHAGCDEGPLQHTHCDKGALQHRALPNKPTASGVFPDARAGRKMVAGASARGHLVVPRVLAIFESASLSVAKVPLATWVRTSRPAGVCREGALRDVERRKGAPRDVGAHHETSGGGA